jgi:hypothetical protein
MKPSNSLRYFLLCLAVGTTAPIHGEVKDKAFLSDSTNQVTPGYPVIAIGQKNRALGWGVSEVGYLNQIDDDTDCSAVVGDANILDYDSDSVAFGAYNKVELSWGVLVAGISNQVRVPFGKSTEANSILGEYNSLDTTAPGTPGDIRGCVILGSDNFTSKDRSWVIGQGNIGQEKALTVGTYANPATNAAFLVGIGTGGASRANAMEVLKDGTVRIPGGNLQLGGSPVATQASLNSGGYMTRASLASGGYMTRSYGGGSVTNGALLSIGQGSSADGSDSLALGNHSSAGGGGTAIGANSTEGEWGAAIQGGNASGMYSFASTFGNAKGYVSVAMAGAEANGDQSVALGGYDMGDRSGNRASGKNSTAIGGDESVAIGDYSFSSGYHTTAPCAYSVAIGSNNLSSQNLLPISENAPTEWVETEALFELGNGDPQSVIASNAITTLKNGQTTLTNKSWKQENPDATPAPADPDGQALVVEGDAVLKGKVILREVQGDISMGDFQ